MLDDPAATQGLQESLRAHLDAVQESVRATRELALAPDLSTWREAYSRVQTALQREAAAERAFERIRQASQAQWLGRPRQGRAI